MQGRLLTLSAIIGCVAVFGATLGLTLPLLSVLLERQGVSPTLIGLNAATPAVAIFLGSFFIPALARRFGARRYVLICIALNVVSLFLLPLFPNVWAWFPIRFLMGVAISGLFVVSESWINQVVDDSSRGRIIGVYTTAVALGFLCGPAILRITGIDPLWPFLLAACVNLLAAIPLLLRGLVLPPEDTGHTHRPVSRFIMLAPLLMAATILSSLTDGAAMALLPLFALANGLSEMDATTLIAAVIAGGLCLQLPLGWLSDKVNRRALLIACGIVGTAGAALMPLAVGSWLLWPLLFWWGGALIGLYTLALTMLGQLFTGQDLVAGNAAFGVMWGIGSLAGPAVGGAAIDLLGANGLPWTLAAAAGLFTLFGILRPAGKA